LPTIALARPGINHKKRGEDGALANEKLFLWMPCVRRSERSGESGEMRNRDLYY
jgi:hypothetical protein